MRASEIAKRTDTEIGIAPLSQHDEALATPEVQAAIENAADGLGLRHTRLPSGAGHDAQMMARIAPAAMVFVPSVRGISHNPKEHTASADLAQGANVLLDVVLGLLDEAD